MFSKIRDKLSHGFGFICVNENKFVSILNFEKV